MKDKLTASMIPGFYDDKNSPDSSDSFRKETPENPITPQTTTLDNQPLYSFPKPQRIAILKARITLLQQRIANTTYSFPAESLQSQMSHNTMLRPILDEIQLLQNTIIQLLNEE